MTVAVITPWQNHPELRPDYMDAIDAAGMPVELIIIDNGSDPELDDATLRFEENAGFSAACNAGLVSTEADIVVFLNNDIRATREGWLATLVEAVEPGVLAGAKLRFDNHCRVDGVPYPYLDGWCLAGMRDDFDSLGGWNEKLEWPGYYSDNLLCLEARARGFRLREVRTGLHHKVGQTIGKPNQQIEAAVMINFQMYQERVRELLNPQVPA